VSLSSQRLLSLVVVGGVRSNNTNETEMIDFSLFLFLCFFAPAAATFDDDDDDDDGAGNISRLTTNFCFF
tara:strand:- start:236 stop:445 length:210 start_codon:yes stop_codon:yes gene_type:complete